MTAFFYYETTPTVMSDERGVTYINGAEPPKDAASKVWTDRCKGEPVVYIPHKKVKDKDDKDTQVVLTVKEYEDREKLRAEEKLEKE